MHLQWGGCAWGPPIKNWCQGGDKTGWQQARQVPSSQTNTPVCGVVDGTLRQAKIKCPFWPPRVSNPPHLVSMEAADSGLARVATPRHHSILTGLVGTQAQYGHHESWRGEQCERAACHTPNHRGNQAKEIVVLCCSWGNECRLLWREARHLRDCRSGTHDARAGVWRSIFRRTSKLMRAREFTRGRHTRHSYVLAAVLPCYCQEGSWHVAAAPLPVLPLLHRQPFSSHRTLPQVT